MENERLDDAENTDSRNGGLSGVFTRAGLFAVKFFVMIMLGVIKGARFILLELSELAKGLFRALLWLLKELTAPLRSRFNINKELQRRMIRAKKESRSAYIHAMLHFWTSYLFGEGGVFYTAFNYILPIVSVAFLVGVIKYGSGLEYGLSVEYNGREIGVITAEADFETAEREVQQRIDYAGNSTPVDLSAKYSLRIISDSDKIVSAEQLANEMLAASDEELKEAYGIYIDGKFIGAVEDKSPIQDALSERLLNYKVDGVVKSVEYKNKIEYSHGIYLADSVMGQQEAIDLLTSTTSRKGIYIAKAGDTAVSISQKFNMDLTQLENMNPNIEESCREGRMVNIMEHESYLPIQYVREIEMISFLDYETVKVETSALNVGVESVLVKGERGEKVSNVEITYVDGEEYSRKTLSAQITKEPVVEQIGVGTYSAMPASKDTKLYGTGEFSWPVDGGYISDPFGSDRNHKGLDIAADGGTDIYAAADGVVVSAGWNSGGYGYFVMIDHLNGYQTVYAHMSAVYATAGSEVMRGQLIGAVGTTGHSTGNHCHFEVRYMGVCTDPTMYLNTVDYGDTANEDNG
jgi:murein DD-endopeptidase MepM/ murein hydrolase activator NlpD